MHSTPRKACRSARHHINRSCRLLVGAICVYALSWQCASAQEGGVYIAGQGASLREAFDQALAENSGGIQRPFWIIVSGAAIAEVTKARSSRDVRESIQRVHAQHGLIYACRSDMTLNNIAPRELLGGVKSIRGFNARAGADEAPMKQRGVVLPQNTTQARLILRTCAQRNETDTGDAR